MKPIEALSKIMEIKDLKGYLISRSMDKRDNYIYTIFSKKMTPRVDTYVSILDACGCDLVIRDRDSFREIRLSNDDETEDEMIG